MSQLGKFSSDESCSFQNLHILIWRDPTFQKCLVWSLSWMVAFYAILYLNHIMRETGFRKCEKTKVQVNCMVTAQLICAFVFCYIDSTIPLLSKSKILGF